MTIRFITNVELSYARRWYQRFIKITHGYNECGSHCHDILVVVLLRRWSIVINYNFLASE